MTARDTARALEVIEGELGHLPSKADREKKANEILGALRGEFLIAPWPKEDDEAATRAALEAMEIPGLFINATKGHS